MARPNRPAGGRPRRTTEPVTRAIRIGLTEAEYATCAHRARAFPSLAAWARTVLLGPEALSVLPEALQTKVDALCALIDTDPEAAGAMVRTLESEGEVGHDHPALVRARALLTFLLTP